MPAVTRVAKLSDDFFDLQPEQRLRLEEAIKNLQKSSEHEEESTHVLLEIGPPSAYALIDALLDHSITDLDAQERLGSVLGKLRDPRIPHAIVTALEKEHEDFYRWLPTSHPLIAAIVQMDSEEGARALLRLLPFEGSCAHENEIVSAGLIAIGHKSVKPLLETLQQSDARDLTYAKVASILGQIQDKSAVEPLIEFLLKPEHQPQSNKDLQHSLSLPAPLVNSHSLLSADQELNRSYLLEYVVRALGNFHDPRALPSLENLASKTDYPHLRRAADFAIAEIKRGEALPDGYGLYRFNLERLMDVISNSSDETERVRAASAAVMLGGIQEQSLIDYLKASNPSDPLRQYAPSILAGSWHPEGAEIIQAAKIAKEKNTDTYSETVNHLIELTHEEIYRPSALIQLGYLGGPKALEYLREALLISEDQVKCAAASSLARLGDAEGFAVALKYTQSKDSDQRVNAWGGILSAVHYLAPKESERLLKLALEDEDPLVQVKAVRAVIGLKEFLKQKDKSALSFLLEALHSSDDRVASEAATQLGLLKDPEAIAELTAAVKPGRFWQTKLYYARPLTCFASVQALAAMESSYAVVLADRLVNSDFNDKRKYDLTRAQEADLKKLLERLYRRRNGPMIQQMANPMMNASPR